MAIWLTWLSAPGYEAKPSELRLERERDFQPYVHSANVAYEDKLLFMSQPIEGWLSGNQKHPPGPCAT